MYIEGFGKKVVNFYVIEGTNDLLELEFSHKRKKYYAIVDTSGRLLVPISNIPFLEVFATNDRCNYCFTRQDKETDDYESFHVQKQKDDKFYLKADIKGNKITNCRLVGTINDDYWFIESTTNGITEVSLYDVKNVEIITPGFTEISFEEEKSRVLAFVEKDLYTEIDGENILLTSLLGFIDYKGNFVTPLYDVEIDKEYETLSYNFDKSFKSFNRTMESITQKYRDKYFETNKHVTEVLLEMFNNLYSIPDMAKKEPAKILEYRRKNSNDKK